LRVTRQAADRILKELRNPGVADGFSIRRE
jgi:hypothetical protein